MQQDRPLQELIGEYLYNKLELDNKTTFSIIHTDAIELLTSKRLDIVAKYLFIKCRQENINSTVIHQIYKDHIRAFSDGEFEEPGSITKKTYFDYIKEFDEIYESINTNGFNTDTSLVPMGADGTIIDGGHRAAIGIFLNKPIGVIKLNEIHGPCYDYRYFLKRQVKEEYLDLLVSVYCKLKKNIFVCCLWPIAEKIGKDTKVETILESESTIVYKKKIYINFQGLKHFMTQIYGHQEWTGTVSNRYRGIYGKVNACYTKNGRLTVYVIECESLKKVLLLKERVRDIFGIGKDSIHITDTKEEAQIALQLLLNKNSLNYLNYGNPYKNIDFVEYVTTETVSQIEILGPWCTLHCYGKNNDSINKTTKEKFTGKELMFDIRYDYFNFMFFCGKKILSPLAAKQMVRDGTVFEEIENTVNKPNIRLFWMAINRAKYYIRFRLIKLLTKIGLIDRVYYFYTKFMEHRRYM